MINKYLRVVYLIENEFNVVKRDFKEHKIEYIISSENKKDNNYILGMCDGLDINCQISEQKNYLLSNEKKITIFISNNE